MSFFAELKRRNVFKVGIAYVVVAWLAMQVADIILNNVEAPSWVFHVIMLVLGIGFFIALVFAWAFEMTPEGLKREHEVDRSQSITHQTGRKLDFMIIGVLVLALGYFAYDKFVLSSARDAALVEATTEALSEPAAEAAQADTDTDTDTDRSIAVLPFVNMSEDASNEYFSDGLSEELLNLLAKVPELSVAARTSSFSLKGKELQIAEVADILKVAHVLEGSVRRSGDRVRITAQLIKADDGFHMWSETYDRELNDVFAIQDEIANHVVEALKIRLLDAPPTVRETNPEAYALALQARHMSRHRSAESYDRAEELYRQALDVSPDYSTAWSGLAEVYIEMAANGMRSRDEGYRMGIEAAERALSLDSANADAHAQLGYTALLNNDPNSSAYHLQRALELDPANPQIIGEAATLVELLGRVDEAIDILQYLVARDPINAEAHANLGRSLRVGKNWDGAQAAYENALALSPGRIGAYHGIGEALLFKGDLEAALETYAKEPDEEYRTKGTAMALYSLGRQEEFEASFATLRERWGEQWPSEIAHVYAWIGDADSAFEWLDKAVAQNEDGLNQQYYAPLLKSLHTDTRWQAFRERTIGTDEDLAAIEFVVKLPQ